MDNSYSSIYFITSSHKSSYLKYFMQLITHTFILFLMSSLHYYLEFLFAFSLFSYNFAARIKNKDV